MEEEDEPFEPFSIQGPFNCFKCNSSFNIKDINFEESRYPLSLLCGHSVCNYCVADAREANEPLSCQLCVVQSPSSEEDLPVHCFGVGFSLNRSREANKMSDRADQEEIGPHNVYLMRRNRNELHRILEKEFEENWDLQKINSLEDLEKDMKEARKMKIRLIHCLKKVENQEKEILKADMNTFRDLENSVTQNFIRLHGLLQRRYDHICKEAEDNFNNRRLFFRGMKQEIRRNFKMVDEFLRKCETAFALENPDLESLEREYNQILEMPCFMAEKINHCPPKVDFNPPLVESIKRYCELTLPPVNVLNLLRKNQLPSDFPIQDDPGEAPALSRNIIINATDNPIPLEERVRNRTLLEGKNYNVHVTHVISPEEFYVTLGFETPILSELSDLAERFMKIFTDGPRCAKKDGLYLCSINGDSCWSRVKVIDTRFFLEQKQQYVKLFYLDTGKTEFTLSTNLRDMPQELASIPPLVIRCKIYDCIPKEGADWSPEAISMFEGMLKSHNASMRIFRKNISHLEVDLSVLYADSQIGRDITSVRDALTFLGYGDYVTSPQIPPALTFKETTYSRPTLPVINEQFKAIVTFVNTPSDFYIINESENGEYYCKLQSEIQDFYSKREMEGSFIYNPIVGMVCVARNSEDNKWYRAKILEVRKNKMLTVFYVDTGNQETIPWTYVKTLRPSLLRISPLALHCTLAGIHPATAFWNTEATTYLKDLIMVRSCKAQVVYKYREGKPLQISLCHQGTFINEKFVELGYCRICNPQYFDMLKHKVKKKQGSSKMKKRFNTRRRFTAKEWQEKHDLQKQLRESDRREAEEEDDEMKNEALHVRVKVLSAVNPSIVYITTNPLMDEYDKLQLKLNEYYKNPSNMYVTTTEVDNELDSKLNEHCAVFDPEDSTWYRGVIVEFLSATDMRVFLKDVGRSIVSTLKHMRVLASEFKAYPTCAIKSHLAEIVPPGAEWPSISCEYLGELIHLYDDIFGTIKGEVEDESIPVELWVLKIEVPGPLEPTIREWTTMNKLLVDEGLAIPLKPNLWVNAPTVEEYLDNDLDFLEAVRTLSHKDCGVFVPSSPCPMFEWTEPDPLPEDPFIAIPTFVDEDGIVYALNCERDEAKLQKISEKLNQEFGDSQLEDGVTLREGQECIAQFHVDKNWYRARITRVNENNTYDVYYVDYGNSDVCELYEVRQRLLMTDIPMLAHKFYIHGIEPANPEIKWSKEDIEFINELILEKKCEITVVHHPRSTEQPAEAKFKIIDRDVDLGTLLVDEKKALFIDVSSDE